MPVRLAIVILTGSVALTYLLPDAGRARIEQILQTVREVLHMDIACVSSVDAERHVFETIAGDAAGFGVEPGGTLPIEESYCRRMLDGELPELVPRIEAFPSIAKLQVTQIARVGSYVGVPVVLSDGQRYGSLCCMSHGTAEHVGPEDVRLLHLLARFVADALERESEAEREARRRIQAGGLEALLAALAARDGYTGEHAGAVVGLAAACGRRLGLDGEALVELEQVALLHDIGKVGIPDAILGKPGPLDAAEWSLMHQHPVISARILESVASLAHLAPAVRAEHERWDGMGYPDGLAGDAIPVASRITLVCDAFHAMTSDRPYRRAMDAARAREEIAAQAGRQFWPAGARALLDELGP